MTALTTVVDSSTQLNAAQTLRATTALLRKIQTDQATLHASADKTNLLADADEEEAEDEVPIWLILTTKKHIIDKKRLKPGKILLPNPYLDDTDDTLRICLITADPQRQYKDLITQPNFPLDLAKRIQRVIGITKLKAKYKSYESRRQLLSEYDVFLADDRVITYLPKVLGKVFYKGGSKRPIPVALEGKRQDRDEAGNKRRKLSEGGTKVVKAAVRPEDVAHEISRTLRCALVHLAPSTTTAVKVGKASMTPEAVQENVGAVVDAMVERYVPQKWRNLRSVHVKGPNTAALPIWMAEELWEDEKDVHEHTPQVIKPGKKQQRRALAGGEGVDVIEVPGPDGQMRRLERPSAKRKGIEDGKDAPKASKKSKLEPVEDVAAKAADRADKVARKEALKKQKAEARAAKA